MPAEISPELKDYCLRILQELQPRFKLLAEAVDLARYFFTDDYQYNPEAVEQVLTKPQVEEILEYAAEAVASVPELDEEHLKPLFKEGLAKFGVKMGGLIQPLRCRDGNQCEPRHLRGVSLGGTGQGFAADRAHPQDAQREELKLCRRS